MFQNKDRNNSKDGMPVSKIQEMGEDVKNNIRVGDRMDIEEREFPLEIYLMITPEFFDETIQIYLNKKNSFNCNFSYARKQYCVEWQNMVQCSDQYIECRVAEWLWKIVPLALLIIGTGGNVVNIIVLSRPKLRRYSTSVYLLVLAVSDTLGLLTIIPKHGYSHIYDRDFRGISYLHCKLADWIGFSSAAMSTWTVVNLTIERALLTMFPIKAKLILTPKVSVLVSLATCFVIQFLTVPLIFSRTYLGSELDISNNFTSCVYSSKEYGNYIKTTWNYLVLTCLNLLPIAIILTGNALIATTLLKRKRQIHPKSTGKELSSAREKMALKILFAICFLYISFTSPFCIYAVVKIYSPRQLTGKEKAVDQLVNAIMYMLVFSNLTFNFVLYFANGSMFRDEWNKIVTSVKNKFLKSNRRREVFDESENVRTIETGV